jgi:4-amino-4-deoxy-L-arabinose transferase-like glycosyltransferase
MNEPSGTGLARGLSGAPRWALLAALVAFALAFQGSRPLIDPDEGRYTAVALGMLDSGDWMTPHLSRDVPHFSKPPLTYWTLAASMAVCGRNEWAVRLPYALAFVGTVLLVAGMARRLGPGPPELAALVQATSLLPYLAANAVTTDTLLAFTETLAMAGFVELRFGGPRPARARLLLWGGLGLAFLTKGPPGLLPLAAILAFVVWIDGARALGRLVSAGSLALFAALAFGWYGAQAAMRPDLLPYLLGAEVVGRVTSTDFGRNAGWLGPLIVYLPVLVVGTLPWWPLLWRRRRDGVPPRRPRLAEIAGAPPVAFLLCWLLLPLAIFCVSRSRLPLYLLPLFPPISLLVARGLASRLSLGRRARVALAGWILALMALKAVGAGWTYGHDGRRMADDIRAAAPYPPAALVFVEHRPYFSLAFYLGVEVEQADLPNSSGFRPEPAYRPISSPLAQELAQRGKLRVFLVPDDEESSWLAELAALGWTSRRAGATGRWAVYLEPARLSAPPPRPPARHRRPRAPARERH